MITKMNKKDREALDKFVDKDSLSPEDTKRFTEMTDGERATFIAERFFEAGAKHGRSQLNELRDDNMAQLYETIKEMQNAYETLQAHDEMLIATVDKLKEEIDELERLADNACMSWHFKCEELEAQNAKLRDALKFYAQPYSWCRKDESPNAFRILPHDREETVYAQQTGGKLARQVLKEVGEE